MVALAYYNEIDPFAAQWLRNLIAAGHLAKGEVDERSILDVRPSDLAGFQQCHFFAGIGIWSHALRLAGWDDDRPVWTGSCPCQPFSAAGKGGGFADERHLWPAFFHLIEQRRPDTIFGEQVASDDGLAWLDLVHDDMEGTGYALGAQDCCSAGFGAPNIRQRLWWVAHAGGHRLHEQRGEYREQGISRERGHQPDDGIATGGVGIPAIAGPQGQPDGGGAVQRPEREAAERTGGHAGGLGDATSSGGPLKLENDRSARQHGGAGLGPASRFSGGGDPERIGEVPPRDFGAPQHQAGMGRPGPVNGFWRDADWLRCRDGRWRPARPGSSPLAHGARARVGRLRAYGNAISPQVAAGFIRAVMDSLP